MDFGSFDNGRKWFQSAWAESKIFSGFIAKLFFFSKENCNSCLKQQGLVLILGMQYHLLEIYQAGLGLTWSETPKTGFLHVEAHKSLTELKSLGSLTETDG